MDSEKALQSFKEFTGYTNDEDARRLLSRSGWDVEQAINAFFALGPKAADVGPDGDDEVVVEQQRQTWQQGRPRHRISHFADRSTRGTEHQSQRSQKLEQLDESVQVLEDEDVQMVEEPVKAKATNIATTSSSREEEQVRAPIEPIRGVLVEQTFRETYQNRERMFHPVFEQFRHDQPSSSSSSANGTHRSAKFVQKALHRRPDLGEDIVFDRTDNIRQVFDRTDNIRQAFGDPVRSQHLKQIFRPPVDLMFRGDWEQALQAARQKGVWLLVNVQDVSEFACVVLNRDIWSDETVREVVRSNFLFLQVHHDSADGARLRGYYGFTTYPAIFIVDPRTGEEVGGLLRAPDPVSFLDSLTTFLDQNPSFEARDQHFRERALVGSSDDFQSPSFPGKTMQSERTVTPTKKRKQPGRVGPGSESSSGMDDNELMREGEEEMNRQAKKIKRVVTITDGDLPPESRKPSSSAHSSVHKSWSTADLNPDEWRKWTLTDEQQLKGEAGGVRTVHMALRLPDGQQKRVRMSANAPLSALFSLLLSMGFAPADHQIVLDYPRREHALSPFNHRMSLELAGFGSQEVVHVDRFKSS